MKPSRSVTRDIFSGFPPSCLVASVFLLSLCLMGTVQGGTIATNAVNLIRAATQSGPGFFQAGTGAGNSRAASDPRAAAMTTKLSRWTSMVGGPGASRASDSAMSLNRQSALQRLQQSAGTDFEVHFRPDNQTIRQIRGHHLEPAVVGASLASESATDEKTARNFLRAQKSLLLLENPDREFVLAKHSRDELGHRHLRFTQMYQGIPVWPAELIVHLDQLGHVHLMDGAYSPSPVQTVLQPILNAGGASQFARAGLTGGVGAALTQPELIIYAPLDKPIRLAWKLEAAVDLLHYWQLVIDAANGRILDQVNLCVDATVTGSGLDLNGTSRSLTVWQQSGTNYLVDTSKTMFQAGFDPIKDPHGVITITDANNATMDQLQKNFVISLVTSSSPDTWNVPDAISAAYNVSQTYDYYQDRHSRNSIDGKGGSITALVRVGQLDNAFWMGNMKMMIFGNAQPYAGILDVIGHELTHGVTENTANLVYENQSGALNEALSDIFGEMVEARTLGHNDWLLGTGLPNVIRNMKDPGSLTIGGLNRPYPSKMSQYIQLPNNENGDNGGVHLNSSIINHAYYLLAEGLDGAVGLRDAERIFYRCLTVHLQAQSQFIDARLGCLASAEELFGKGSTQAAKTAEAFDAVEIVEAPSTPDPSPIPVVQGADSTIFVAFDPFFTFDYVLGRRESAQSDPNYGVPLAGPVRLARPSVLGDGSYAIFVDSSYDLGAVDTKTGVEERLGYPGQVHAVVASPDGRLFAFVLRDAFTGQPQNKIMVIDTLNQTNRTYGLVAPVMDSAPVDAVLFADSLTFTSDGSTLIYDAVSRVHFANIGNVERWSLFALDLAAEKTIMLVPPLEGLDTGNPALGHTGNRYLVFDAQDTRTQDTTIMVMDLFTGDVVSVGSVAKGIGYPCFTGDDSAVIYAKQDAEATTTGFSLVKQNLAANHLGTTGTPSSWLTDSPVGVIYRRGSYVATNALPQITLTAPVNGATFASSATITITAAASDQDGQVAKVEFYEGSTKLGESSASPYQYAWNKVSAGTYRLVARAVDNLGGITDSPAISITVGNPTGQAPTIITQPQSQTVNAGTSVNFSVAANGTAPLAFQWLFQSSNLNLQTADTLTLNSVQTNQAGEYRVIVSNASGSVTSAPAILTVVTPGNTNALFKITGSRLTIAKELQLDFASEPGKSYQLEASTNLLNWSAVAGTNASGATTTFSGVDTTFYPRRFYRVKLGVPGSRLATMPEPGLVYPGGTQIGGSLFGVGFTIPNGWLGGMKTGTPYFLFASDSNPGIAVISALGFAGDQNFILQDPALQGGFQTEISGEKINMGVVKPLAAIAANRLSAEYQGTGVSVSYYAALDIRVHPSGGFIVFMGLCTADKRDPMKAQLQAFGDSVQTTPRPTNTAMMLELNGRSFQWAGGGNDWYSNQAGVYSKSASVSDWSDNYAFFCAEGTFEVNQTTTTYASTVSASNEFMGLSGSSTTTEYGQWTIVQDPQYGNLIFMVTLSGYQILPIKIDLDGSLLVGPNRLTPHGTFNCH